MRLSVVMAVRDGERHVGEAIESVLSQSVSDFEFLIVDDASTDDTRRILASYEREDCRIRLLHNEQNLGPYPSANRALMQCRGMFVARHDADDISPPIALPFNSRRSRAQPTFPWSPAGLRLSDRVMTASSRAIRRGNQGSNGTSFFRTSSARGHT